jgi:hypothetical protein
MVQVVLARRQVLGRDADVHRTAVSEPKLTRELLLKKLAELARWSNDPESAHGDADELLLDSLNVLSQWQERLKR